MTREKALEASRAVDAIDGFEAFMEQVDMIMGDYEYDCLSVEFRMSLNALMKAELARLEKILEDL